jgi:hypothetical protein
MSRPWLRSLGLVFAALVLFAACGGGGDGDSSAPTTDDTTEPETDADDEADDVEGEAEDSSPTEDNGSSRDPGSGEDAGFRQQDIDEAITDCLDSDLDVCFFLGVIGAPVPPTIEPDTSQVAATADEILTECFAFGIVSACYEAGVRNLDPDDTPGGFVDDGVPDEDIGQSLLNDCASGNTDACLELGQRKFPPPPSFSGAFEDAPDLTVQSECFDVGVQEACYEAGLRGISASTVIGE